jgi:phosphatidylglycerol:prolipoprotein diacylglycerol transferase
MHLASLLYIPYPDWLKPEIIPGFPFRWYGLMYLFAFTTAYLLVKRQVREEKLQVRDEDITNLFFWTILGLLLGGRILATLVYDTSGRYWRNPLLIFWPFDEKFRFVGLQGMSYHGGLLGAVLAIVIYCKRKKFSILEWGDRIVAAVPLGYTFGRLGNFINGELYGRITSVPWGMLFPHAEKVPLRDPRVLDIAQKTGIDLSQALSNANSFVNLPRHPSQLYEAFFEGIFLWLILWVFLRKRKPFPGFLISSYLIGYGAVRFILEYYRQPDAELGFVVRLSSVENPPYLLLTPWNFTTGQVFCFFMILAGAMTLGIFHRRHLKKSIAETARAKPTLRKLRKRLK